MNNLEKYLDRVIVQKPAEFEEAPIHRPLESVSGDEPMPNVASAILRRWYIVLLTFVVLCAAGIPAIWLLIQKSYVVSAAIRVDPIIPNILTGTADRGDISNYQSFMYTQARMVTSPQVVRSVADDLATKGLTFFEERTNTLVAKLGRKLGRKKTKPEPEAVLKGAILDGIIMAEPLRRGEFIEVIMKWHDPEDAKRIVGAFMRSYMAIVVASSTREDEQDLALLEKEQKDLSDKMGSYSTQIAQMAQEFGSKKLAGRYDMKLTRVGNLETVSPQERVSMREEYVIKDPGVQARTTNIVALEQGLIIAKQDLAPGNPQIKQKEDLLEALRTSLEEQKKKARERFDELMKDETANLSEQKLAVFRAELAQAQAHENELRDLLSKEDEQTIGLGQKELAIQDWQDQLAFTKEMYDRITRRIQEFNMERKRPARISSGYDADVSGIVDKRAKYTVALVFGAMALGMLLAFLRDKADRSFRTPDDVARRSGLRIIGTTTSTNTVRPASLPDQVAGDYQTIRANLGMLEGGGMPRTLVVTSPGMQEGKTTFAVNLAISVSKSGKKVLLIDGDLRNPCIASLLGLPKGSRGLQDVLLGKKALHDALYSVPSSRLDVIAADSSNTDGAFELLASSVTVQRLSEIGQGYDHVIIDTPPVLAFADALIWAKVADGVILTCFAGLTTSPNLKKAKERLARINANVLGTVLSNVEVDDSYHPYGYHYYPQGGRPRAHAKRVRSKMLLPMNTPKPKVDKS
jgi:capsular exopolysaccharide synthesis family protein